MVHHVFEPVGGKLHVGIEPDQDVARGRSGALPARLVHANWTIVAHQTQIGLRQAHGYGAAVIYDDNFPGVGFRGLRQFLDSRTQHFGRLIAGRDYEGDLVRQAA